MATILIVDDLAAIRKILVALLRSEGHRLLEAADGREGLAVVRAEHPDLVITDVLMPLMDGYELVRQLRLDPATRGTRVVFHTAHYGEREARALALSSGVSDVLTKPSEPDEVLKLVGRVLAGKSVTDMLSESPPLTPDFDREHLQLLTDKLSTKVGDLRTANARLRALINIGLELASERNADKLLQEVCTAARDLFGATYVTLGILDPDNRTVKRFVTSGVDAASWLKSGDTVAGVLASIVTERRTVRVENPGGDPAALQLPSLHPDVKALLAAPIASPAEIYGWICLVGNEGRSFSEDDEQLVTALAGQVGRIYESDGLYAVAQKRTEALEHAILERTNAEAALLEAGALQSAVFSSANFSCIATDAKGVIQLFNVGAERMFGYSAADVVDRTTPADLHDPQEVIARAAALSLEFDTPLAPGFEALVFKAARGIEDIYQVTGVRHDGSRFPALLSVTALRNAGDAIIGYLLIGTDNTARKLIEVERQQLVLTLEEQNTELSMALARLEASEERLLPLQQSIAGMLEGIQIIDRQWQYVYLNAAAARQGRSSATELVGRTMMECYPGIDATPLFGVLTAVMETRSSRQLQTEFTFADGTRGWFELSVEPDPNGILIRSMDITERKQAEGALLKAGALQGAIFSSANFACIATDAKGVIQLFNVGAERMLGYASAEVTNRISAADLHDPQESTERASALSLEFGVPIAPGFEALVFKAARGIEDIYEVTKVRKDGSRFQAVVSVTALRDAQEELIGYLLIATDNTARQQVEEERKRLDQRLRDQQFYTRSLIESNIDALMTTDPLGIITDVNKQMETLTGCTRDELIGAPFKNCFTDQDRAEAAIKQVLSEQKVNDFELTARARDGKETAVSYNATTFYDRDRRLQGVFAAARDVTDRKQVEDALRQSEERFRGFVTASSDVVYRMSPDWSEMRQLHGRNFIVDTEKPSDTWFQEYIHPDDQPGVRSVIDEAIRTKSIFEFEHRVRRVDGTLGWTFSRAIPLLDAKGEIVEWFGAASDVTERKSFEETLRLKNVELEAASRMKSEFLANMSHELRTPLNAIIGFSEVLRDGLMGELTDQQRGFIGDIFSSGNHLLSLINDILDLSKVEAGKMALDLEPVKLSALFANSLSVLREKAVTQGIRLELDASEELGSISADERKIKQIVYNLLSNAVKFSSKGGQVTLSARRVPRAEVGHRSGAWTSRSLPLAESEFEEFLEIDVSDQGIGISSEGLDQLFKPFSQIDGGLARKFEGTGLGLAMVKLLAELHGGTMAVASAVGEGSCFTVWLPFRALEERALSLAKAPPAPRIEALVGARIALVVEGDFKAAELIRLQLEAEGYQVLHAASAEAALVVATQQPLALITLDILLPNMDGWEFLSRIKQVPDLRRVPVVIISIAADRNKGFALGASAVMQKPISRLELYEALVDLGLLPRSLGQTLKVLVVDDDPMAVQLIAIRITDLASTVLRASSGREAIEIARQELPDVIVLDLMMPELSGFDVVEALKEHPDTARIPILVVTAKQITAEDRARLNGYVSTIMEKAAFDRENFTAEVRRATAGRLVAT